jgi:hypothetical protein
MGNDEHGDDENSHWRESTGVSVIDNLHIRLGQGDGPLLYEEIVRKSGDGDDLGSGE